MKIKNFLSKASRNISSFYNVFKTCLSIAWRSSKFYTLLRIAIKIVSGLVTVGMVFITKNIINTIVSAATINNPETLLVFYIVLMLILRITSSSLSKLSDYISTIHNETVEKNITVHMMNTAVKADMEFFDSTKYYDAFEAVNRDIKALANSMWFIFDSVQCLATIISAIAILTQISPLVPIIVICAAIPATIVEHKYIKALYLWSLDHIVEERKLNYLNRVLTQKDFAPDIRLHNIGSVLKNRYANIWNAFFKKRKALLKKRTYIMALFALLPEIALISIILYVAIQALHAQLTIGDYSLYVGMLEQLMSSVYILITLIMYIYMRASYALTISTYLRAIRTKSLNVGKRKIEGNMSIEFKDVRFKYPETDRNILEDVSFTIEAGEKVCLIGINGAGKSTIIKLILRFYDVDAGEILVNGYNIKEYDINNLRKNMSCLFQKYINYAFSLQDNIAISDLSKDTINEQTILKAIRKGDCSDILNQAPRGLKTYLTKDFDQQGLELSGGQQQKIAIARLFYENGKMVILDEPSAALDPEAEYKIFQAFEEVCAGRTALFTSHRLTNVHLANKIIVLENGRIIESGTHDELMKNPRRYSILYKYQADKFTSNNAEGA